MQIYKCLIVREWVELIERNKDTFLPSSKDSIKENSDRKKIEVNGHLFFLDISSMLLWIFIFFIIFKSGKYDMAQELLRRCLEHNKVRDS